MLKWPENHADIFILRSARERIVVNRLAFSPLKDSIYIYIYISLSMNNMIVRAVKAPRGRWNYDVFSAPSTVV
jgi:hypothetical protein